MFENKEQIIQIEITTTKKIQWENGIHMFKKRNQCG